MIAASELKMTNGEFAFIGLEYDIDKVWNRQSLSFIWAVPNFCPGTGDFSKCKDFLCNIMQYYVF